MVSSFATKPLSHQWAAQCEDCLKWRKIPTKEEFEEIRNQIIEEPFSCRKRAGGSCSDPAEFEYNPSRQTWYAHKPNAPKTPAGFKSLLVPRKTVSDSHRNVIDVYYEPPVGRRLRSPAEVAAYIAANPDLCKGLTPEDFSFARPKIMADPQFPVDGEPSVTGVTEEDA